MNKIKSIKAKLILIGLMAALVTLLLAAVNLYSVHQSARTLAFVFDNQKTSGLQEIERALGEVRFRMAAVLIDQMPVAGSKIHLQTVRTSIPEQWRRFKDSTHGIVYSADATRQIDLIDKQIALLPAFFGKLENAYAQDDRKAISSLLEDEWPAFQGALLRPMSKLTTNQQLAVQQAFETGQTQGRQLALAGLAVFAVSLLLLSVGIALVIRAIILPLNAAVRIAQTVASGDLSSHIDLAAHHGETGQLMRALHDMTSSLRGIVAEVHSGTELIASASHQIAGGNLDLSARTEQQAAALEATVSSMEELTATFKQMATIRARPMHSPLLPRRWRCKVARWSTRWWQPWARSTRPRARSSTSSPLSTASRSRPISWRSTQPSKRRAPANRGAALPSSPPKYATWPSAAPAPPAKSRP